MTYKKILASLALITVLSACNNKEAKNVQNVANDEEISQALEDNNTETTSEDSKEEDTSLAEKESDTTDYDKRRDMIVEFGEFDEDFADELSDEEIDTVVEKAKELSEETGYWDQKDFVFQELAIENPYQSSKFPLDSIAAKYNQEAAEEGELTDRFNYERTLMGTWGYPIDKVWGTDDYYIQEALKIAYMENEELYFDDYVKRAADILFLNKLSPDEESDENTEVEKDSSDSSQEEEEKKPKKPTMRRFGSSQTDYDAIKSAMVQYYEFSPSVVNQMTNEDIDKAYTRAMDRLEETGFGDIGLIFDELGKMYPGASTMYPGE